MYKNFITVVTPSEYINNEFIIHYQKKKKNPWFVIIVSGGVDGKGYSAVLGG